MFLKKLCETHGVSGDEAQIRQIILDNIKPYADEITIDIMGNMIALKKGSDHSKKVILAAHMDEVGLIITSVTDAGFLKFQFVGGIDARVLVGKRVCVGKNNIPGVIALKAIHLQTKAERENAVTEKKIAGEDAHSRNYNKKFYYQRPMSSYGATKVLDAYGIEHKYEKQLGSDEHLKSDLLNHLRKGKPIIFTVSRYNRETKKYSSKWTSSFHTMIMIGVDKKGDVLIGNPGSAQRFQLVDLDEMTNYMWSCTDEPNSFYWDNSKRCGGYIKIME